MPDPFSLPFMQRAALEVVLLAPIAGLLGAQIVLRRLAFFTHGVGAATFPGLVVAGATGFPPALAALLAGGAFAALTERFRRRGASVDASTALVLVVALAAGTILASDVFESGALVDQLLFGSLLAIGDRELLGTGIALAVLAGAAVLWRRDWIARGFDPVALPHGRRSRSADLALLGAVAVAVVAALAAVGAVLVAALLVVPAATVRLFAPSVRSLELGAAALALAEGLGGLWIAYRLDVPPGPAIAVLAASCFALCLAARASGGLVAAGGAGGDDLAEAR